MANKRTQREYYNAMVKFFNGEQIDIPADEMVKFAEERIAALDKKSANRKPTKVQEANVALKEQIATVLTAEGQTVTEILTALNIEGLSNQKVASMLKQMTADGIAVKTADKKRTLYALA